MNLFQDVWETLEHGKSQTLVRLVPLITAVSIIIFFLNFGPFITPFFQLGGIFLGLADAQSMDNAQLARQIVRGKGFTTEFLRPHAVAQLRDLAIGKSLRSGQTGDLFPADKFPPGTPRILPDTYNAPGYPYLLAAWNYVTKPEFEETSEEMAKNRLYSPDRLIPALNQIFLLLTAVLVFVLGIRLFDERVAWVALVAFLSTELIWHFSITGMSTTFLMFLITATLLCVLEIFHVGETCFDSEERSFLPAWIWTFLGAVFLGLACLTRLHQMVLLVPISIFLMVMPRATFALVPLMILIVAGMVGPWFYHLYQVSGNYLGSSTPLMLFGEGDYKGNQIYCATSIPNYERLFKDAMSKESSGFRYNFEHAWSLLGSNPFVLLFGVSILHQFKRRRTRLFHWLIFACTLALIAANNLGWASPDVVSQWNVVILLFPCMVVIGAAFFFILLDRLQLQLWLLNNLIVTSVLILTFAPLFLTLSSPGNAYFPFPPYWPPAIKSFGQMTNSDEWVTTDMPWATAWYADRASLWLPDSIADFESLHDNVCPSGILLLTPATWSQPIYTIQSQGEYKDWFSFVLGQPAPSAFPLSVHTTTGSGGPQYSIWSDRPRWSGE
jgi:hypothetical protein